MVDDPGQIINATYRLAVTRSRTTPTTTMRLHMRVTHGPIILQPWTASRNALGLKLQ
jgi:hypothetical protein